MKHLTFGLLFAALGLGMVGCNDDNPWMGSEGEGTLRLSLSTSADVIDAIPATRASEVISAPDVNDFSIMLEKNDGSYSKEWASIDDFKKEPGFKTGSYTITAFHGSLSDEGFEKPYFEGSATVTVLEAHETAVAVTASLANSMVSLTYTEAFSNYFADYSAKVHSDGHSYVEYAKSETRPAFIAPGDVDLTVSITDRQGRTVQVQPASFVAEARHHYHVTLDVNNGNVGEAQLVVSFDDTLVKEDVFIDLTDELFTSPAPTVTLSEGYTDGQVIEILQNDATEQPLKFSVMARGGLSAANLTINSETYSPAFGNEIDLVAATPAQQSQLTDAGVRAVGFFNNPDKMAMLDLSGFAASLPAGRHTVTLVAKDKFTRVSDPVSVTFDTNAIAIHVTPSTSLFGSNRATLAIDYNGRDIEKAFSFKAEDNFGGFADCKILSSQMRARTRAIETKTYDVAISLPSTEREEIRVKVFYYGKEVAEVKVPVVMPSYSVDADAFSNRVLLKVSAAEDVIDPVVDALKVFIDGNIVSENNIVRDKNQHTLYVKGLTPEKAYTLRYSLTATAGDTEIPFTTEAETPLPNGDLSQVTERVFSKVHSGGEWSGTYFPVESWIKYYWTYSDIKMSDANGWASLNPLTCWENSSVQNTWFMVPSTIVEDGVATIRSVGYSHNGTVPEKYAKTSVYYNINAPQFSDSEKSIGEMFLGSYSFDGSGHRQDGTSFGSRPKSVSFDYSYSPVNGESGVAYISLLDASGEVVGSATANLSAQSSMTSATVAVTSYKFGKKASSIRVGFKSTSASVPAINVPSGDALQESQINAGNFTNEKSRTIAANQYKAVAVGSVLKVKNIKLNY